MITTGRTSDNISGPGHGISHHRSTISRLSVRLQVIISQTSGHHQSDFSQTSGVTTGPDLSSKDNSPIQKYFSTNGLMSPDATTDYDSLILSSNVNG